MVTCRRLDRSAINTLSSFTGNRRHRCVPGMAEQSITRLNYKFRLYPTRAQDALLVEQLGEACRLYNGALQERCDAWRINRQSLNYYQQASQLKEIRAAGDLGLANFSACQDVLRRVEKTFQAFFARVKRKEKAGFPRFKSHTRYDSITFPAYGDGCKLIGGKLRLQGVGLVKVKLHRPLAGKIKTVTIKRQCGKWYALFSVECEPQQLPPSSEPVGIDVGLLSFATLSDGREVDNPRWYRQAEARLRRAQRRVARRKLGSHRRRKAVRLLAKIHQHIRQKRSDFHHKEARKLVNRFGLIAVEDLHVKGLARGMLAKSVSDAGWSSFINILSYKAEWAGRELVKVNPGDTSQICVCGAEVPKDLSQRWHQCPNPECGLSAPRDHVSAQVILRRALGLSVQAVTWPVAACVA